MKEWGSLYGGFGRYSITASVVAVLLLCNFVLAEGQDDKSEVVKHKIFTLMNISAQQGKEYLDELGIGTVSRLPGTEALLITAQPYELTKAVAILQVVDAEQRYIVKSICSASDIKNLPSNAQIATAIGDISIGNFSNPPIGTATPKAIIDSHGDNVLVIAPSGQMDSILLAIEQLQKPKQRQVLQTTELSEPKSTIVKEEQEAEEPSVVAQLPEPASTSGSERTQPKTQAVQSATEQTQQPQSRADLPRSEAEQVVIPTSPPKQIAESTATIPSYSPEPIANGEEMLKLNLPEKLSVIDLLGLVGEYLHLDYMYDPAKVKGEVTLKLHGKLRGELRVKDLYPLLESVLKFRGFVTTRKGNLVTIVPQDEALEIDPALVKPGVGKVERGDVIVTRVFELEYIDTASAKNLLDAMKLTVDVTPIEETRTLIVTGYAYRMPRIEQLLELVDKPGEPRKFRFRQLEYTMARTLADKVKTLAEQLGTVSVSISISTTEPTITRRPGESEAAFRRREAQERVRMRSRQPQAAAQPARPSVYLDADERTNRILMIGIEEQLSIVEQLINALDVEQQDLRALQLYKIEHVEAKEVREKLQELGIIGGGRQTTTTPSRITAGAQPGEQPRPPRPLTTTTTETEPLVEEPQVVVIESTNSLLVNATPEQHAQIRTIIGYVDSETLVEEIPYKLYPLENQSPGHLAEVLEKLIQETVLDKEGKIETVIKKKEEQITIVPDPNTFSLIVYASKKNQEWIASLIKQLDKRRPQVLIDVTLVEISKTDEFNYDLDLVSGVPDITATSGLVGAIDPNIINKLLASGRSQFVDLRANKGIGTGFYGDRHINMLLSAMQQKNYGRVLAKPKILVNDNAQGTIQTTDTTYVTKKSSTPWSTGAAGQQATVIETAVDFQGYDAGITLDITPHISEGDLLRLDVALTRSDFGTITGDRPPDTTASEISTTVTVPNGSTIILGGMLKLNQSKGGSKVPILGDLPIVGGAFRTISNSDLQRKLYVFVKAEIIRPAETLAAGLPDLERISNRNRMAFQNYEMEFQRYKDWPGFKPKPMDPMRVLEAQ
jgi:general secretion pathway protein D